MQKCSVNDSECCPGRLKLGMCELHYRRVRTTGSTVSTRIDNWTHYLEVDGCWVWQGARWRNGYGKFSRAAHGTRLAHRAFYMQHAGPIPDGFDLDHLCRNRACVNPQHLEPVTRLVNLTRGIAARSDGYCKRGHDQHAPGARWTEPSTGRSSCRACKAIREAERRQRRAS